VGAFMWKDKTTYTGEWRKGQPSGNGKFGFVDGSRYAGSWDHGKFNNFGTYDWSDGAQYVGQFQDGKMEGEGRMLFVNEDKYEGDFQHGKMEGEGAYYWSDGRVDVCEFEDGVAIGLGIRWDDERNSVYQLINGEEMGEAPIATDFIQSLSDFTTSNSGEFLSPPSEGDLHGFKCPCQTDDPEALEQMHFFLPRAGITCSCGAPFDTESVVIDSDSELQDFLWPWQVNFLESVAILSVKDLFTVDGRSAGQLSRAMEQWRRQENLSTKGVVACSIALRIWCSVKDETTHIHPSERLRPAGQTSMVSTQKLVLSQSHISCDHDAKGGQISAITEY